eukprot:9141077-Lingulodinium_polyedra.AAC.1
MAPCLQATRRSLQHLHLPPVLEHEPHPRFPGSMHAHMLDVSYADDVAYPLQLDDPHRLIHLAPDVGAC